MRIGFDVRPFLKEETGVGIYFKNLLFTLAQVDQLNEYYLFSASLKDRFPFQKIPSFTRKHFRDFPIPVKVMNFFWYTFSWPPLDYFFGKELDVVHSPTPLILPTKGKKIVTVHDLFFMDFPQMTDKETKQFFFHKMKKALQKADGIVVVSNFTKKQLIEKFSVEEEKVKVIYHGLDTKFYVDISPEEVEEIKEKFSLPPSFILFVGAIEPRKNLLNLIKALKIIHKKYNKICLVLIGRKGQDYQNLKESIKQNGLESWVKIMGYLSENEVRTFYHLASVFVFPSLCEGFGLPLIEAMASGLPVVSSLTSAMPEIAEDAALYFHPENPDDIAEKIILALRNEDLRQTLKIKGKKRASDFNWEVTAAETLHFYEDLLKR